MLKNSHFLAFFQNVLSQEKECHPRSFDWTQAFSFILRYNKDENEEMSGLIPMTTLFFERCHSRLINHYQDKWDHHFVSKLTSSIFSASTPWPRFGVKVSCYNNGSGPLSYASLQVVQVCLEYIEQCVWRVVTSAYCGTIQHASYVSISSLCWAYLHVGPRQCVDSRIAPVIRVPAAVVRVSVLFRDK